MKIVTIARNPENSPNMVANDAAILECVTKELTSMGAEVIAIGEQDEIPEDTDAVCHMSRSPQVLQKLKDAKRHGINVVNPPVAVENCSRTKVMEILESNGTPQPIFRIINDENDLASLPFPAWIKRGEGWSCHKDDISFAHNCEDAIRAINGMRQRGIESFVYTAHCKGDIVKFYGVGNRYFTYCYPDAGKTKFGLEKINGETKHYPFDAERMHRIVAEAAKAVGLKVYGGDCIVDRNGGISVIDLNDFPSFSSVRNEAAKEIADIIMDITK